MSSVNPHFDPHNLQGQYAGFVTRLVAFLIDLMILSAIYSVTVIALQAIGNFFQHDLFAMAREQRLIGLLVGVGAALFPAVYSTFFWALTGQTPGKALMGIRIYTVDGQQITLRRALIRYIGYSLSAAAMFVGFFLVLVDDRRQTFHDKLAKTVVVYAWEARMHRLVVERSKRGLPTQE